MQECSHTHERTFFLIAEGKTPIPEPVGEGYWGKKHPVKRYWLKDYSAHLSHVSLPPGSESDCYVQAHIPTVSCQPQRTVTVNNSCNPVWNHTFKYRIYTGIKNVLELSLYDKDYICDDFCASVLFDVGTLSPGQPARRTFTLNPESNEELEVEFELRKW
ncbi:UNVERIFIED_CONTAM: hypothetical protein FKN15_077489 [Acipenser sinensis]